MRPLRYGLMVLCLLLSAVNPAAARVNVDINVSLFPELVPVPGYPVYYAPAVDVNYFFYDGMYWVYHDDDWYASDWYNGPWEYVEPAYVPVFVLRVPVRYYRRPPVYFHGWIGNAPPRWGNRWGHDWEHHHRGWDHWDHRHVPARAPVPYYQRDYGHDRYPHRRDQQSEIRDRNYRYRSQDEHVRQHFRSPGERPTQAGPRDDRNRNRDWQQRDNDKRPPSSQRENNSQSSFPQRGDGWSKPQRENNSRDHNPPQRGRVIDGERRQDAEWRRPALTERSRPAPEPVRNNDGQREWRARMPQQSRETAAPVQRQRPQPEFAERGNRSPRAEAAAQSYRGNERGRDQSRNEQPRNNANGQSEQQMRGWNR